MSWSTFIGYTRVSSDDHEMSIEAEEKPRGFFGQSFTKLNVVFFVINILILSFVVLLSAKHKSPNQLLKETNTYTPILESFDFSFHTDYQEYSSFSNEPHSIYKASPSPEVDEAWEAIAETPPFPLSKEQVIKLGKDPEYAVEFPENYGFGKDKFVAGLDGQHLIHCLNEVRKYAHWDYYYEAQWGNMSNMPAVHSLHRAHCFGMLLDTLRCQPSINMITFNWIEGSDTPFPDMKAKRQCQNTDELFRWVKEESGGHAGPEAWNFSRPEGAKQMPP